MVITQPKPQQVRNENAPHAERASESSSYMKRREGRLLAQCLSLAVAVYRIRTGEG